MCDCYKIGGPWIAEDPECPVHGYAAVREREEAEREERARDDELAALRGEVEELRKEIAQLQAILAKKLK